MLVLVFHYAKRGIRTEFHHKHRIHVLLQSLFSAARVVVAPWNHAVDRSTRLRRLAVLRRTAK